MHQLTQLGGEMHRQRLAHADQQRPVQRLLAHSRATRQAERPRRRTRSADSHARRRRAQLGI